MPSLKSLAAQTGFFLVAALLVLTNSALGGDIPFLMNQETSPLVALPGEKAVSESGFDYFIVEQWDGERLWSNKSNQWDLELNSGQGMGGIWGVDGQDIFIASTWDHGVLRYQGGAWFNEYFPSFDGYIQDVWGFDRDHVFALGFTGEGDGTHLFRYDGSAWSEAGNLSTTQAHNALWGPSPGNLFLVGSGGDIAHFDGENLTAMDSGSDFTLRGVWGTGSQNVYAVGANGTVLHFDGNSWEQENTPPTESGFYGVWGSGPDNIYVVGSGTVLHFNGGSWSQLPEFLSGSDYYDVFGSSASDVYVVGWNGVIKHFDGETWSDEPNTGGQFRFIWGGLRADGDQNWSSDFSDLGEGGRGLNGAVYGMLDWDGGMALSGNFTTAGTDTVTRVAHWDGITLSPIYNTEGPNDWTYDLIEYDGELIAGGRFTSIDGVAINAVAAWNGTQWRQLGAGLGEPSNGGVVRMVIWDGKLVTVGDPQCTAAWDGTTWTPMADFEGLLVAATVFEGQLLVGGQTTSPANGILFRGGDSWLALPGTQGDSGTHIIYDFATLDGDLVVGGIFSTFGIITDARGLVRLSATVWSNLGGGTNGDNIQVQNFQDGLLVSGAFTQVGDDLPAQNIAFFNGTGWHALGSGLDYFAWTSQVEDNRLTVAGSFIVAGNHPAYYMAQWEVAELAIPDPPTSGPAEAGQDHTVAITLEGDPGAYPVTLYYRLRDEDPYQASVMHPSPTKTDTYEATVPGDFFGELGFQYFVASGSGDNPVFFPTSAPAEPSFTGVVMVDESLGIPLASQYVMMGIPFVPDQSLGDLLVDAFGSYDKSKWRFGSWDPRDSSYDEFPNMAAHAPGRGYWLIQKNPVDLPANGVTTSTVGAVVLTLEPGWNQIATPYNFVIPWSAVTLGPNVQNRLVARSGGGYVDVNQMNPWQAYWVRNTGLNATTLTIPPTPMLMKSADPVPGNQGLENALWAITLGVEKGDRYDRQNIAAVVPEASAGIDGLDYFEPPALPGDVSLFFELAEDETTHALTRDIRAPFENGVAWDLVLRRQDGSLVELNVSGVGEVPGEHGVYLLTQDGTVDLRQTDMVSVRLGSGGETRLRLVVGEPDFVAEQERSLPRPFALRTAYPNPFNPKTTLSFTLPRTSQVSLDIFDLRGRLVRHLVDESFEAGLHEVPWNGLDDSGRSVSAGVYFSRMRSDDFQQTSKMTLVR